MKDLNKEQLLLLNTDFGEDLEKQAAAIVAEESEKVAELQNIAESCVAYGSELAMQKIAEMEAAHQEKVAMEEEKKEDDKKGLEKKKEDDEEEDSEEEKNASAMGNFILEGYWKTMMEKGAEYYGDENIYVEELCKEAKLGKIEKFVRAVKGKAKKVSTATGKHLKKHQGKYYAGAGGAAVGAGANQMRQD